MLEDGDHRRGAHHFKGAPEDFTSRLKEKEVPLDEPFDVGAFTAEPGKKGFSRDSVLQVERISITGPLQTVTLVLDKLPRFIGIDPFNERIDRNSNDNLTTVKFQ